MSVEMTLSEFAEFIRRDLAWVCRLRDRDRLVMTADGRVCVEESVARIEGTSGNRPDVAERNAERRDGAQTGPDDARRRARALAELRIKEAEADRAEMARDREAGELLAREDVGYAMRDIGAAVRTYLENFPAQVAPLVAAAVRSDAISEIEHVLEAECRNTLSQIAAKLAEPEPWNR